MAIIQQTHLEESRANIYMFMSSDVFVYNVLTDNCLISIIYTLKFEIKFHIATHKLPFDQS